MEADGEEDEAFMRCPPTTSSSTTSLTVSVTHLFQYSHKTRLRAQTPVPSACARTRTVSRRLTDGKS